MGKLKLTTGFKNKIFEENKASHHTRQPVLLPDIVWMHLGSSNVVQVRCCSKIVLCGNDKHDLFI